MRFIIVYCAICSAQPCEHRVRKMEERGDWREGTSPKSSWLVLGGGFRTHSHAFCLAVLYSVYRKKSKNKMKKKKSQIFSEVGKLYKPKSRPDCPLPISVQCRGSKQHTTQTPRLCHHHLLKN